MWRQATLKQGLRWGVTTHLARSLSWFQPSHGKDAGGEYDGNNPEYWDFYHKPFAQNTASYPVDPPPSWRLEWFLRVRDLIDRYKPDLMYFDGSVPFLPDGRPGLDIIAHLYNSSIKWHGGQNQAVMNIKDRSLGIYDDRIATLDLERQQLLDIRESPWQNDTSIGPWFYTNGASYKPPAAVIHMLVDIVSKNGNLLLNVPMRADGTIDEEAKALLKEVGKWMKVNGEAIYGTRPWIVAGEKTAPRAGDNRWRSVLKVARTSDTHFKLAPEDVRFTAKGDEILYAIFAGWPQDGRIVLHGLTCGPDSKASVLHVELLGRPGKLESSLSAEGLVVRLPEDKPCEHAWVLKISGKNLRDFEVRGQPDRLGSQESNARRLAVIEADDQGTFILPAEAATIHGPTPRLEHKRGASAASLGFWNSYRDWVSWRIKAVEKGTYRVSVTASSAKGDIPINVQVNGRTLTGEIHRTGSWEKFIRHDLGKLEIDGTGVLELEFRPAGESTWKPVGLMEIRLVKLPGGRGS